MSLSLAGYYHYWEKCIFNAITKCIISSMATFLALLQSKDRPPLCEVKANLNGKDLVVTPTVNDIYKYLTKSVKNIVESARMFVRWMHGTCCQTAPQVRQYMLPSSSIIPRMVHKYYTELNTGSEPSHTSHPTTFAVPTGTPQPHPNPFFYPAGRLSSRVDDISNLPHKAGYHHQIVLL